MANANTDACAAWDEGRQSFYLLLAVLLATLVFIPLCYWGLRGSSDSVDAIIKAHANDFAPHARFHLKPEPNERRFYFAGVLFMPAATLAFLAFFCWLHRRTRPECVSWFDGKLGAWIRDAAVAGGALVWLYLMLVNAQKDVGAGKWVITFNPILYFFIVANLLFLMFFAWRFAFPIRARLLDLIALLIFGISSLVLLVPDLMEFVNLFNGHFVSTYMPIWQALHGKTVLVDLKSQYGILNPHVAEWIFRVVPFTVFHVSIFFVILIVLTYYGFYRGLDPVVPRNSPYRLLALAVLLGSTHPFLTALAVGSMDFPYYQSFPVRTIFPALVFWLAGSCLTKPTRAKYLAGLAAAAVSVLWNMDTGMVLLVAWVGFNAYLTLADYRQSLLKRIGRCALHAASVGLALLAAVAGYALFAYLRCRQWPHWGELFEFQAAYYVIGYGALPMKPLDLWQLVLLAYLLTGVRCAWRLFTGQAQSRDAYYAFLSLFGIGIFSYYQGRSVLGNLFSIAYPAVLLGLCFYYEIIRTISAARLPPGKVMADGVLRGLLVRSIPLTLIFAYAVAALAVNIPGGVQYWKRYIVPTIKASRTQQVFPETIRYIRDRWRGKEVAIFSERSDEYLYVQSGTVSPFVYAPLAAGTGFISGIKEIQGLIDKHQIQRIFEVQTPNYKRLFCFDGYASRTIDCDSIKLVEMWPKDSP